MPKGVPNKRYTPEFKKLVIETMQEEKLSYSETCRRFEVNSKDRIKSWERIYLEKGPEGFAVERRGRSSKGRPPKRLPKEVTEDLLVEVQRLRAEVDYLKNLQALVLEDERCQHKNAGSSKAKAKTRTQYTALNRSTAPCNLRHINMSHVVHLQFFILRKFAIHHSCRLVNTLCESFYAKRNFCLRNVFACDIVNLS